MAFWADHEHASLITGGINDPVKREKMLEDLQAGIGRVKRQSPPCGLRADQSIFAASRPPDCLPTSRP